MECPVMKTKKDSIQIFVDSLTSEEYSRLIQIAAPLTDEERAKYDAMSVDDLARELES